MGRKPKFAALALIAVAAGVYVNNTSLLTPHPGGKPVLLAHRGMAQRFDERGVKSDTCTATRMLSPTHDYLENTLPSMRASFEAGADIVELDVHPTTDGQFAVFHDWTIDCRTDGRGVTREQSMAKLKMLDIGYGYTADGGKTFPFRGKGIGMMPTLPEVLATFPDKGLLINVKSRDASEGEKLAAALNALPTERRRTIMVYGGDEPIDMIRRLTPDVRTISRAAIRSCLIRYIAYGWTGLVPPACRNAMVLVPVNVAPWLWGWPNRFLNRMTDAGSAVFVLGPYSGGEFSTGVDTPELFARLPQGYSGGIWTNEIETVARIAGKSND
ncbi:glycerophosphodiester phosphodiesterase [Bradyrhizobium sp. WBOS7]|uniref:Glycerophosphodiester phosphodiesterase n=1 Tax=Bradyrhizobium betae TaxID=244734 RepID=A0AAE9NF74_9BRAD|nr:MULTISPECIES: glycerophosphodiester phosphodiesterase family protein [Bradyrhizobium]MDD1570050.1 glycerophosphodiester phosphodiesterase [Bradyrhizobium sp. WBOS1]UUO36794.1 glycerophosphodiester phosphodiesterase [Bradyrhizobium sp. WBOS01]MDD1525787.1 glycerophosphodiester phosphodiesterase [Bradyrhizobium sp. WBOS2]MDD1576670.1 glycerophosphodiester phosphodiesterase [Bradyrhizobium sp. WBOS7]MDD1598982.1 glycerophosphodiester phosphodiesterase [Bradyrhizobium sp. WBOS16]